MYKIHSTSQSVIFCCSQLEMFHKTHITSISDFLLSSTWDVSQDSYHFNQWFPVVLNLICFTRFISLQSVISCCPQIEMFHKIHITSVSDFLLSSNWNVSQDSYHFSQWFPAVLKLKCFTRFISLQSVISCCPQLEMFHKIHITSFSDSLVSSTWDLSQDSYHFSQWFPIVLNLRSFKSLITSVSDFLLSSNWNVSQDSYHFNQWFSIVLNLRSFKKSYHFSQGFPVVLKLRCFTWFISLQSVISCCPQFEIFQKSYHFNQWFPIVLNLRSFKSLITSVSDFLLSSNWNVSQDSYHFNQ